jgi:gamma-glutamyltranspeptidase
VLPLGVMLLAIGGAVLGLARPLHEGWRDMNRRARAAGHRQMVFGTEFFASERGLRTLRRGGAALAAIGVALLVAWALTSLGG